MRFLFQNVLNPKLSVLVIPQEALENLKEAIELYIENAKVLGIFDHFSASIQSLNEFTSNIGVVV